jgi:pyridoxamine 5'-phosphate oxidase
MDYSDLRRDFGKFGLDETRLPLNPIDFLKQWLDEAQLAKIPEFNAMVLSTVGRGMKPSSRIVLLKEITENGGIVFYTNYHSRKGEELLSNPNASINIFWHTLEKQIRIEGKVRKVSREKSEAYFRSRPLESQLNAIVSPQSEVIKDLSKLKAEAEKLFVGGKKISLPPYWGGYELMPETIEFWQGGKNRLHDRIRYQLSASGWSKDRLAP